MPEAAETNGSALSAYARADSLKGVTEFFDATSSRKIRRNISNSSPGNSEQEDTTQNKSRTSSISTICAETALPRPRFTSSAAYADRDRTHYFKVTYSSDLNLKYLKETFDSLSPLIHHKPVQIAKAVQKSLFRLLYASNWATCSSRTTRYGKGSWKSSKSRSRVFYFAKSKAIYKYLDLIVALISDLMRFVDDSTSRPAEGPSSQTRNSPIHNSINQIISKLSKYDK